MRASEFVPKDQVIARLESPKCGKQMILAQIEPYGSEHDCRMFEFSECDNVQVDVVQAQLIAVRRKSAHDRD